MTDDHTVETESAEFHGKLARTWNADATKSEDCFWQDSLTHDRYKDLDVL